MEITRHFTATVLVVYNNKVLLHKHKKRGSLLPVGGHLDRDELPEEAALREVKEEAGLEVHLYSSRTLKLTDARVLVQPAHILLIDMNPYHQHIDFVFYASADTAELNPSEGESGDIRWYSKQEVQTVDMPENIRVLALEALELLSI